LSGSRRVPLAWLGFARRTALFLLGIDVGGTKTALGVGDASGRLLARERIPTEPSEDAAGDLVRIASTAKALLARSGVPLADVSGVGLSLPGCVDDEKGTVLRPPNLLGWERAPIRATLESELGARTTLENDANAAALAEWRFGAGQGFAHVVYLTMSTGVGGGLVLGGRLHRGFANSAGEVGHLPLVWEGALCRCGKRGCVEAYIGGAAWQERLARETPPSSAVARLAAEEGVAPRPEHVVAAARARDAFALAELERYNDALARTLALLVPVLAPEVIVLGTIPTAAGEELCLAPVRARLRAHTWPFQHDILVRASALGELLPFLAGLGVALEATRGS
jgi:glucokinase